VQTNTDVTTTGALLDRALPKSTYFQFQDQFYEQTEGMAMVSALSPVVERELNGGL